MYQFPLSVIWYDIHSFDVFCGIFSERLADLPYPLPNQDHRFHLRLDAPIFVLCLDVCVNLSIYGDLDLSFTFPSKNIDYSNDKIH